MKTLEGETYLSNSQRSILARCGDCGTESSFSKHQVAAAHRVWKLGSGLDGVAATYYLGGDGTTNQCNCGMECEVVFTGDKDWETYWRRSRCSTQA